MKVDKRKGSEITDFTDLTDGLLPCGCLSRDGETTVINF